MIYLRLVFYISLAHYIFSNIFFYLIVYLRLHSSDNNLTHCQTWILRLTYCMSAQGGGICIIHIGVCVILSPGWRSMFRIRRRWRRSFTHILSWCWMRRRRRSGACRTPSTSSIRLLASVTGQQLPWTQIAPALLWLCGALVYLANLPPDSKVIAISWYCEI